VAKGGFQGGLGSVAIKALNEPPQKPQSPVAITVAIGRTRYSEISGGVKRGGSKKWSRRQLKEHPVRSPEIAREAFRVRERERAASDKNLNPKESIYILEGLHTDTLEHTHTHTERESERER